MDGKTAQESSSKPFDRFMRLDGGANKTKKKRSYKGVSIVMRNRRQEAVESHELFHPELCL